MQWTIPGLQGFKFCATESTFQRRHKCSQSWKSRTMCSWLVERTEDSAPQGYLDKLTRLQAWAQTHDEHKDLQTKTSRKETNKQTIDSYHVQLIFHTFSQLFALIDTLYILTFQQQTRETDLPSKLFNKFDWVSKVILDCVVFALSRPVIGPENSPNSLNQSRLGRRRFPGL